MDHKRRGLVGTIIGLGLLIAFQSALADNSIRLLSTTSTDNSGLYEHLLPLFTKKTGIRVYVVAMGTGQALRAAKNGDGDLLIVHAKSAELAFMEKGYGSERREFMHNDFVVVGPASDPAGIRGIAEVTAAMSEIYNRGAVFVSRGDDSGTHKRELWLWEQAGISPDNGTGKQYREVGAGMGKTLNIAATLDAYTLVDRGTWLSFRNRQNLQILVQGDGKLFNQYSVIELSAERYPHLKVKEAKQLADWLVSDEGQSAIDAFRINNEQLFSSNYQGG